MRFALNAGMIEERLKDDPSLRFALNAGMIEERLKSDVTYSEFVPRFCSHSSDGSCKLSTPANFDILTGAFKMAVNSH
ncbi:MAG: hypothetical protein AMS22_14635 [Thiotrichales bacterium SG8_50]|nr:MAG: hypothetical protein AMS22_14635 [Thiotrichales bacterium SG8_50]